MVNRKRSTTFVEGVEGTQEMARKSSALVIHLFSALGYSVANTKAVKEITSPLKRHGRDVTSRGNPCRAGLGVYISAL
jgi:hypothetical protein